MARRRGRSRTQVREQYPPPSQHCQPVHCCFGATQQQCVRVCVGLHCQQVDAALFEPPPFQPAKLSVQYLPGSAVSSTHSISGSCNSCTMPLPRCRRYTLTHNDITGALQLSVGSDYNQQQVQGFYTRILRDEITAEWLFCRGGSAPAELHIYCHVSGEERWLAPPQLRNFIFRREMTLVSKAAGGRVCVWDGGGERGCS